jgi:hypothetical protein
MADIPVSDPVALMVNRNPWKTALFVTFEGIFGEFDKKAGRF